jgi:hypothetical protein
VVGVVVPTEAADVVVVRVGIAAAEFDFARYLGRVLWLVFDAVPKVMRRKPSVTGQSGASKVEKSQR